jgi:hypothetical protein
LFLDALTTNNTHTKEMEVMLSGLSIKPKIFNPFEAKIFLLHRNMLLEVIKVIKKNWEFLKSFVMGKAHNMMAIMLDPHFKALCIVENLVGHKNAIRWHLNIMSRWLFFFLWYFLLVKP